MKIFIASNSLWNLSNFRKKLITNLIKNGHEIIILVPDKIPFFFFNKKKN